MTEFWLISAPGDKTCQQTWDKLNAVTTKQNALSTNYKFQLPELKVGTLDQLVGLSDELAKLDTFTEAVVRKIVQYLAEVLEAQREKLLENLVANGQTPETYLTHFQWDMSKYPVKIPLPNITDIINKQVGQIDADLKARSTAYNNLKSSLQSVERKTTGSLLVRYLGDLVKEEHFVLGSEYLTTLLVVVPKSNYKDWQEKYEKLSPMVVPNSSMKITEDNEHGLFTVTLFRKVVDEFKQSARREKFIVRDFEYNPQTIQSGKDEKAKLESDKKKQYGILIRWLKINFGEAFMAWCHVKALRLFVESVLRYGLPVNFQGMLLQPNKRSMKRLREELNKLYSHLDTSAAGHGPIEEMPGLNMGLAEYYPYVYFKIGLDFAESK